MELTFRTPRAIDATSSTIDATLSTQDFGLAVAIQKENDDDKYELTGGTGSRRYMAPEVCREEP